jgi:hypothetical protein
MHAYAGCDADDVDASELQRSRRARADVDVGDAVPP